jgi:GTP-binding protein
VGKSSLFNRLLRRSAALVDDRPGVTRDRHYAPLTLDNRRGLLIDTGGFEFSALDPLAAPVTAQVKAAVEESDLAILVVDGRSGLHPRDYDLAALIRESGRPAIVCVNKIDRPFELASALEFHALGLEPIEAVSAAHGLGLDQLRERLKPYLEEIEERTENDLFGPPKICLVGRPNAGKSSLINRLAGASRQVVDSRPGTTRDAVDVEIKAGDKSYVLVDTAGIRRKGRVEEKLEKLSVLRALKGLERSDLAILTVDALVGVGEQDAHIAGYASERGRPLVILINKWDAVEDKKDTLRSIKREMDLKMVFIQRAPMITVSAKTGAGLKNLWPLIDKIMAQYSFRAPTAEVNRILTEAAEAHSPPQVGRVRLKFYYAAQVGVRPPKFVIFTNRPEEVHFSYKRFLINRFREALTLELTPIELIFKPRRNVLEEGTSSPPRRASRAASKKAPSKGSFKGPLKTKKISSKKKG